MIKIEFQTVHELVALHRGLLEARFCEIPNDPDVSGSPILSRLHREVISQIISCESSQKAQAWKRWLEISPSRREWSVAIDRARASSVWKNSTDNIKAEFAIDLLSPFETTDSLIESFICDVDR